MGDSLFECDRCHGFFLTERQLEEHISQRNSPCLSVQGQPEEINCIQQVVEPLEENLGQLTTNTKEKTQTNSGVNRPRSFRCFQCGKTLSSRNSQRIHMRIHSGEKPLKCKFCEKRFRDGGTRIKHERIHTGERPYVCPVCAKSFNQRVILKGHIRTFHLGAENLISYNCYDCTICGQLIPTSSELSAHLLQHSDDNRTQNQLMTRKTRE